jgi:hypothetical protein
MAQWFAEFLSFLLKLDYISNFKIDGCVNQLSEIFGFLRPRDKNVEIFGIFSSDKLNFRNSE